MKAFDTAKRNTHTKDNEALKLIKNQKDFPFTLDMLKAVFNNATTEQESILQEMVDELNRFDDNDIQMYKTYKLDTRDRLEHFWAQCVGEVGAPFSYLLVIMMKLICMAKIAVKIHAQIKLPIKK